MLQKTEQTLFTEESSLTKFNPLDWWIYKTIGPGIDQGEQYLNYPACKHAEMYFLLFLQALQKEYKNRQLIKREHLHTVTVQSYDRQLSLQALAIHKKTPFKKNVVRRHHEYDLGEETFLLLTSPLAGTICQAATPTNNHSKLLTLKAIRPLTYNQPWITHLFEKEIQNEHGTLAHHELTIAQMALDSLKKRGYIENIIFLLTQIGVPVTTDQIFSNSRIPKVTIENRSVEKMSAALINNI